MSQDGNKAAMEIKSAKQFRDAHRGKTADGNQDVTVKWGVLYDEEVGGLLARGNIFPKDPGQSVSVVYTEFDFSEGEADLVGNIVSVLGEKPGMGLSIFFDLASKQPRPKKPVKATVSGYVGLKYFSFEKVYSPT